MEERPDDSDGPGEAAGVPATPQSADAQFRTFLIGELRGYTSHTETHGSDAAAELATRFAAIVRSVVEAHDGILLELRGDEALVVFALARRALRAAVELQRRIATELPQGVGIGLDAGEAIPVEGGYRGSALNLAARLCSQAGPGETLASEAVIHLAAKVDGVGYTDPRTYRIKGMAEAIRAVHVVSADKGSTKPIRYGRDAERDRRMLAIAGVGALAVILVVVALSGAFGGLGGSPTPTPTSVAAQSTSTSPTATVSASASLLASASPVASLGPLGDAELPLVAFIDPSTGEVAETQPIGAPTDVSFFADEAFWILTLNPFAMNQIDPETHATLRSIAIPLPNPATITMWIEGGTMWIADGLTPRVIGIDIRTGVIAREVSVAADAGDDRGALGVAVGDGSLWVSLPGNDFGDGEIIRLDLATGEEQARIGELDFPEILSFGEGAIWVTGGGTVRRIDPGNKR